ncbi:MULTISPECIES: substrate-binding periplasmic protein [Pseudoalteromonas]|uniref:ABC-type amino acid transport/signal transduction system, periplasmic component/domain protein n=1 Tax=Pseudoalteromonas luteoviolacea (strain 2ta16) TaxID=1353533 RepID=V4HW06_PSEL2|nr:MULTISPECIES: transporter substrate-binding domain-containing protein [Pseudoalteromonas]ESP93958.1 ABC-type amino acid transport/signal transduction system, periplasmic component/domain protein [Pseudoalteromonas luteoviolacea 2ta16]KZN31389.1 amino acid ABC transporter substrate-binding protein [Pseudoalteromonas luteoviolacea NCIMB 1944]MCG7548636.1 transporter substrate-binding domain-containing protein [Pseudoalteromonas sp. Of7M-16]
MKLVVGLVISYLILFTPPASASLQVGFFKSGQYQMIVGAPHENGYLFSKNPTKEQLHLVTLDWPPYIGDQLCNKGWVFQFTISLLVDQGYPVYVEFLPWARAVKAAESGRADILFPEYFIEDASPSDNYEGKTRRELLALSNAYPGGEIGFIKRRGERDSFEGNLNALKGTTIGVVRGYQNTPEFDAMMDNGEFVIVKAVDDLQLVKLLVGKRVDLIIGDPKVLRFTVSYSNLSKSEKVTLLRALEDVQPALRYNNLFFALSKKKPRWRQVLNDINKGLYIFNNSGETERIIEMGSSECY